MARTNVLFSAHVVESDRFLSLPLTAQALYMHLCFAADADGFLSGARRVTRACEADSVDLEALADEGYILNLGDGFMVIRDWWLCNKYDKANHHKARTRLCEFEGVAVEFSGERYRSAYSLVERGRLQEGYQKAINQSNTSEGQGTKSNSNLTKEKPRRGAGLRRTEERHCPNCGSLCIAEQEPTGQWKLDCIHCHSLFLSAFNEAGESVWNCVY